MSDTIEFPLAMLPNARVGQTVELYVTAVVSTIDARMVDVSGFHPSGVAELAAGDAVVTVVVVDVMAPNLS